VLHSLTDFACFRAGLRPLSLKETVTIVRTALERHLRFPKAQRKRIIDELLKSPRILVQLSQAGGNPKLIEVMCRSLCSANAKRCMSPMLRDGSLAVAAEMRSYFSQKVCKAL